MTKNTKYYVTTPIYYINDKPHIGHAYTTIAADVLARYHRQLGRDVKFSTGVDENAQKTVNAAEADRAKSVQAYADGMVKQWEDTWKALGISHSDFIRTTEAGHKKAVYAFLQRSIAAGDIYKGNYEGLYCVGCEEFKAEGELVEGLCPIHKTKPELVKEENYFFKLSKYRQPLLDYIREHDHFVQPTSRYNEVVAFIERGLEDISVSRSKKSWGIPWPEDKDQTIYVWFDALINYLTVTGYPDKSYAEWWPANVHMVGKDIIKFHCIIWPAMLMSAGIELPKSIFANGFFTIDGTKISKSLGNVIDPVELANQYGIDALRYYLLREIPFGADGDFSHERFATVYTTELANDLGNAVQRTTVMINKYLSGAIGEVALSGHDEARYREAMEDFKLDRALAVVWELVRGINQLIDTEKPWVLAKSDPDQLVWVLGQVVADLRQVGQLLLPFLPTTAGKILHVFEGPLIKPVDILFPRIDAIEKINLDDLPDDQSKV